jgi:histone H3/H4
MGLIVKSKIKEILELNVSSEFEEELERKTEEIIRKAQQRAKSNGRRTIFARDL